MVAAIRAQSPTGARAADGGPGHRAPRAPPPRMTGALAIHSRRHSRSASTSPTGHDQALAPSPVDARSPALASRALAPRHGAVTERISATSLPRAAAWAAARSSRPCASGGVCRGGEARDGVVALARDHPAARRAGGRRSPRHHVLSPRFVAVHRDAWCGSAIRVPDRVYTPGPKRGTATKPAILHEPPHRTPGREDPPRRETAGGAARAFEPGWPRARRTWPARSRSDAAVAGLAQGSSRGTFGRGRITRAAWTRAGSVPLERVSARPRLGVRPDPVGSASGTSGRAAQDLVHHKACRVRLPRVMLNGLTAAARRVRASGVKNRPRSRASRRGYTMSTASCACRRFGAAPPSASHR